MTGWLEPGVYVKHTHNPRKVYTKHRDGELQVEDYPWVYNISFDGIAMLWVKWLKENCQSPWGWWFGTDGNCRVGFTDRNDMMHFAMVYHAD